MKSVGPIFLLTEISDYDLEALRLEGQNVARWSGAYIDDWGWLMLQLLRRDGNTDIWAELTLTLTENGHVILGLAPRRVDPMLSNLLPIQRECRWAAIQKMIMGHLRNEVSQLLSSLGWERQIDLSDPNRAASDIEEIIRGCRREAHGHKIARLAEVLDAIRTCGSYYPFSPRTSAIPYWRAFRYLEGSGTKAVMCYWAYT